MSPAANRPSNDFKMKKRFRRVVNLLTMEIWKIQQRKTELYMKTICRLSYQCFNKKSFDAFDPQRLYELCEERPLLFGNNGKVVNVKYIHRLHHSLALVRAIDSKVIEYSTEDDPGRKKIRLSFIYKGTRYDFPITDPIFKQNYQYNANVVDDIDELLLTLSVGVPLNDWHYKLVAGVIVM